MLMWVVVRIRILVVRRVKVLLKVVLENLDKGISSKTHSVDGGCGDFQKAPKPNLFATSNDNSFLDPSGGSYLKVEDFNLSPTQYQPPIQPSGGNDFDVLFAPSLDLVGGDGVKGVEDLGGQQSSGIDGWDIEFGGGTDVGGGGWTTELDGLPPPPSGVTAAAAKNKGMDIYKQGQYPDAIKWLLLWFFLVKLPTTMGLMRSCLAGPHLTKRLENIKRLSLNVQSISMATLPDNLGIDSGKDCKFPAGVRVLVVDHDFTWLKIVEQMLKRCNYLVTTCSQATAAMDLLRERKCCFDLVLIDVHTPDMDGFKLLEFVGLEMNLPVIMMSTYGRTSAIIRGIRHGACDYLIKPIHEEELKNIWQHVVRKMLNEKQENSSSLDEKDLNRRGTGDVEYASSVNKGSERILKDQKKRRDFKKEDGSELDNDISASKKPRVLWSVELHQKFVISVNQLGIDKAVPKKNLELMNVPGLTRDNVASHFQKFRLYLRRLSVPHQQMGLPISFHGHVEQDQGSRQVQKNALGDADVAHRHPPWLLWAHFLHIFPAMFLIFSLIWLILEL
ncbi:hypothetical protein POM88_015704 [Heracleum sosnowskyi]|uniref:Response regulatory domain-containing protein n=1 Tax=Heracleum sosnowskyi TaxID=360622 RepID=A0AAD8MW57_9APIA|nr:hypothetical protein POM88_015704 [Heracleum sosnowskyi]